MDIISATNRHTGQRMNLYELVEDGRRYWFLPQEVILAEGRPVGYDREEQTE